MARIGPSSSEFCNPSTPDTIAHREQEELVVNSPEAKVGARMTRGCSASGFGDDYSLHEFNIHWRLNQDEREMEKRLGISVGARRSSAKGSR